LRELENEAVRLHAHRPSNGIFAAAILAENQHSFPMVVLFVFDRLIEGYILRGRTAVVRPVLYSPPSRMKTTVHLDYSAVRANTAQPVHLVLQFDAPALTSVRPQPVAFSLVLDRSGSMSGPPLAAARRAAATVVQNLRREDFFSLVAFDDQAQTIVPMAPIGMRQQARAAIETINEGGSTNLAGGWMLGRDQFKDAPKDTLKRLLLLTDGQLNHGIVEPEKVRHIVAGGLEADAIRTSCLGFGRGYNEDLLATLAQSTGGVFYDANDPDKLPGIFAAELDGLQKTAVHNLRLRFKLLDFVERLSGLGDYPATKLPDGRVEVQLGDLVSDEQRIAIFVMEVLPIPLLAAGRPAATLDGEALLEVEIACDVDAAEGLVSHVERHIIRVRPKQDAADIQVNETVLPWVSAQQAAGLLQQAITRRDANDIEGARKLLVDGIARLRKYHPGSQTNDAVRLLEDALAKLADDADYARSRKAMRYSSSSYLRMRSSEHWTGGGAAPSFMKPPPPPPATPPPTTPPSDTPIP
jgi:Ca-activated chloride channel family protein